MENKVKPKSNFESNLVAQIPKEEFKSLFHFMVGSPDNEEIILPRLIIVKPTDIARLYDKIIDKLNTHQIEGAVVTVDITYQSGKVKHFNNWNDFNSFTWDIPEETSELYVKFDFLMQLPNYHIPQRHTVAVRILSQPDTISMLRSILSKNLEELEKAYKMGGPVICRVDYVNNVIGKELLDLVKEWNECCPIAVYENKIVKFLRDHPSIIDYFLKYLTVIIMSFLSIAIFMNIISGYGNSSVFSIALLKDVILWAFITILSIIFLKEISSKLANFAIKSFHKYGNRFLVFDITSGDKERQKKILIKNGKNIRNFFISIGLNLLINIIGGVLVWYLLKNINNGV